MKVMLMTLPDEGQTVDYTTAAFHQNNAVRYIPLGILCVAQGISPHHEVQILDASSQGLSINQALEEIETFKPDVLGISAVTRKAYAMAEILRRANVPLKVVISAGEITIGGESVTGGHLIISPNEPHIFNLNGNDYRGKLKLMLTADGNAINAVNLVPLEP